MAQTKRRRWPFVAGGIVLLIIVAALVFRWDWLIPTVEARASAALGRPVHVRHLYVALGRTTHVDIDGITVDNPKDWPGAGQLATIERLGLDVDVLGYITHRTLSIPLIAVTTPQVEAQQLADGRTNYTFPSSGGGGGGPKLGGLRIDHGHAHVRLDRIKGDFAIDIGTQDAANGGSSVVADGKGTYAGQPLTAHFVGGGLLTLQDGKTPYPVDLKVANGPTTVALQGTVDNPLAFAGTALKLEFAGPNMALLLPLTGIAIPETPPYRVAGKLDYAAGVVKFTGFSGRVGSSDLAGDIEVDTKPQRPVLTADLHSTRVDLKDLGGFIGATPGDADKGTKPAARTDGRVLPDQPIDLPKLTVADIHLKYRATRIEGRSQPLDDMRADLDIVDGDIHLHPLSFGIGRGQIISDIALNTVSAGLHAKATIDFQRVDVGKLLAATGTRGAGTLGGRAAIEGTGKSLGAILGDGNGDIRLFMGPGGNVSALLVDLSGLQFGNALMSALGVPNRAILQCFAADVPIRNGLATAQTVVLETDEGKVGITGTASLRSETLDLVLKTEAKHFSIGSLPTPIDIKGSFASPSIAPEIGPLALRGGAAIALGIVGTPLAALLPTIQFGTGETNACHGLLATGEAAPRAPARR